jgi:hypothetical protein
LKVFISEVKEGHSHWAFVSKPVQHSIRIVASQIGYSSHSHCQLFSREKALMCAKKNSCDQFTNLSLDNSVLKGADDGIARLELVSIVWCPVSVFQNGSCC